MLVQFFWFSSVPLSIIIDLRQAHSHNEHYLNNILVRIMKNLIVRHECLGPKPVSSHVNEHDITYVLLLL